MRLRTILMILTAFYASAVHAEGVTVGNVYVPHGGYAFTRDKGGTYIDLVHPASANGVLLEARFAFSIWEERPLVTIKFFRRNGDVLRVISERGPFGTNGNSDVSVVPLSPPVRVNKGDLIGIALPPDLGNDWFGGPMLSDVPGGEYLLYPYDVEDTLQVASGWIMRGTLGLSATGDTTEEYTALVIPVVGSTSGFYGSESRTSIQIVNPYSVAATGRLVFRPERAGGDTDVSSILYDVPAGSTRVIPDVAAALGRNGLGSIDVVTKGAAPAMVAHIYHDRGDGGRFGMTVDAVDQNELLWPWSTPTGTIMPTRILQDGVTAFLLAPGAGTNARFNIGVRTLGDDATIRVTLHASTGETLQIVTKEYEPNYFEQLGADEFLGSTLTGGESIEIEILTGSAIVYGCTIDNVTNDPSMRYAYGVFARPEPDPGPDQEE